ncbi:helix-turn-helix domain-containing protein [Piscirickettsia salmonis]|uniref:helix-turn-helix transcriptional regulator n=1 Tax=Piscirickettsia salmonis TaxID=1238 RepID=UPI0009D71A0F
MLFSPREKEVLYWAANGLNAKDTSKAIGVTPRVVEKYLASAQKRLLCKNKLHTVMKAKSLGLLDSFLSFDCRNMGLTCYSKIVALIS